MDEFYHNNNDHDNDDASDDSDRPPQQEEVEPQGASTRSRRRRIRPIIPSTTNGSLNQHSYLPGTTHPLYTPGEEPNYDYSSNNNNANSMLQSSMPSMSSSSSSCSYFPLAILELNDVVLMPGSTLPIRLTDRKWIQYLGYQIDQLRRQQQQQQQIRIGILCRSSTSTTDPSASPRRNSRYTNTSRIMYGYSRSDSATTVNSSTTTAFTANTSHSNGTRQRVPQNRQRRQSWTRQGYGPTRMQTFSQRLIQELGADFSLDDDDSHDDSVDNAVTMTAAVVHLNSTNNDNIHSTDNNDSNEIGDNNDSNDSSNDSVDNAVNMAAATHDEGNNYSSENNDDNDEGSISSNNHRLSNNYYYIDERKQNRLRLRNNNRYLGRIGTIATIVTTHGDSMEEQHQQGRVVVGDRYTGSATSAATGSASSSSVWRQNELASELIITVLGVSRFQIRSYVHAEDKERDENLDSANYLRGRIGGQRPNNNAVRTFYVEELNDKVPETPKMAFPSYHHPLLRNYRNRIIPTKTAIAETKLSQSSSSLPCSSNNIHTKNRSKNQPQQLMQQQRQYNPYLQQLGTIMSVPANIAYRTIWPYQLMIDIKQIMERIPAFDGLLPKQTMSSGNDDDGDNTNNDETNTTGMEEQMMMNQICDEAESNNNIDEKSNSDSDDRFAILMEQPHKFSFWVASNLALEVDEKVDVLEMSSTIERLQYIYEKIRYHDDQRDCCNDSNDTSIKNNTNDTSNERKYDTPVMTIHCKNCYYPITRASSMFTLSGTEGTTGNYVNEYGHVHQTITIREIGTTSSSAAATRNRSSDSGNGNGNDRGGSSLSVNNGPNDRIRRINYILNLGVGTRTAAAIAATTSTNNEDIENEIVWYTGRPETRDSWFPGYSWLIMSCGFCGHHLGWKFQKVENRIMQQHRRQQIRDSISSTLASESSMVVDDNDTNDGDSAHNNRSDSNDNNDHNRPDYFFGLSAANVSTFIPEHNSNDNRRKRRSS